MVDKSYIQRKLLEREKYYQFGDFYPFHEGFSDLYKLVIDGKKKIILLGDAGYGKSTELEMVASRFTDEKNQDFIPLLIPLNTYVDEEIEDYVKSQIGQGSEILLNYDKSKLLFLFDEYDQVIDKVIATRKIKKFIEKYNTSVFVIACRTNFYSEQFEDFVVYVLTPFTMDEIEVYSDKSLQGNSTDFMEQLKQYFLFDLARNPFFLKYLIEIYIKDKKVPKNRSDIFSKVILNSLEYDQKKLSDKYDLIQKYPLAEVESDLKFLSIIMEVLQKNFISVEEYNKIISDKEKRQILSELALIKKSFFKEGDAYQFQHNNFQEYLAAKILSDQKFSIILDFITIKKERCWIKKSAVLSEYVELKLFGIINITKIALLFINLWEKTRNKINKINPSWTNTLAFLCQLREKEDLLNFLAENEPEMTLKFETSRIEEERREKLFKTIFEKYTFRKIWIDRNRINYEELANFVKTKKIYDYLMKFAQSRDYFIYRYNAIEILMYMKGAIADENALCNLLVGYATDENENQNVRHICFYALSRLGMDTQDAIERLKHLKDTNDEWVLAGFYHLIKESNYTDEYVGILLSGLPKSRSQPGSTKIRLADERFNLILGLEKIQSIEGIKKIIEYFINNQEEFHEFTIGKSMEKIVKNISNAYSKDNSIYDHVKNLIRAANKIGRYEIAQKIQGFFTETGTNLKFFKEIYNENKNDYDSYDLLVHAADKECINFLLNEYNNKNITDEKMWTFINLLPLEKKEFHKMINEKTGKFNLPPHRDYEKERREQLKRKIEIIFDKNKYLEELSKIFKGENKDELTSEEWRNILLHRDLKREYNEFVITEIEYYLDYANIKKITLNELREWIEKKDYEWFTINHIFDLYYNRTEFELSKEQKAFITNYCFKNFDKINFREALKLKDNGTQTSHLAVILWYFLRKFDLNYPENILLDMLSFDWFERDYIGIDYLEKKLPVDKVKKRILENLNKGISISHVLKNHIDFCKKYCIQEAKESLFKIIEDQGVDLENRLLGLETIATFTDSVNFLRNILDSEEVQLLVKSAKILISLGENIVKEKLIQRLSSKNKELALESAKLLVEMQDLKGIKFYIEYIKKNKKFEVDFDHKNPLQMIKTIKSISMLFDLLKFAYQHEQEIQQDKIGPGPIIVIMSVLKNIALENFPNFIKVRKKLHKFIGQYTSRFKNVNFLNIYYDEMERDFFINYTSHITIDEAISKVETKLGNK